MNELFPELEPAGYIAQGPYRYLLTRRWREQGKTLLFVMCNPSTADDHHDDNTLQRCIGFAKSWDFAALEVVNLFAWRSKDPTDLLKADDPCGPENDTIIQTALAQTSRVIVAWGSIHPRLLPRAYFVSDLIRQKRMLVNCLGYTKGGHPVHPLYLQSGTIRQPWTGYHAKKREQVPA